MDHCTLFYRRALFQEHSFFIADHFWRALCEASFCIRLVIVWDQTAAAGRMHSLRTDLRLHGQILPMGMGGAMKVIINRSDIIAQYLMGDEKCILEISESQIIREKSNAEKWTEIYKGFAQNEKPEPDVGRVAHGVASRVDRLKAIGNGQVPAVARLAFQMLMHK